MLFVPVKLLVTMAEVLRSRFAVEAMLVVDSSVSVALPATVTSLVPERAGAFHVNVARADGGARRYKCWCRSRPMRR